MMIEAFDEVTNDAQSVEDCKVWLLKQKQTQDWKTTKATADAVYGLLLRGDNLLSSDALVEVVAGQTKDQAREGGSPAPASTSRSSSAARSSPRWARSQSKKTDDGVAWGSVHWQYLEDMSKVTPHEGTPLKLTKTLFVKEYDEEGPGSGARDRPAGRWATSWWYASNCAPIATWNTSI